MEIGTFRSLINAETQQARACHVSAFVTRNKELWNADYRISLKNLVVSVFITTFAPKSLNDMEKNYNILNEDSLKVCEPELAFATERKVRKVNVEQLMAQGYMTLEQSKALIERKIHNHFHSRCLSQPFISLRFTLQQMFKKWQIEPERQILPPHMKIGTFRPLINAETLQVRRLLRFSVFVTRNIAL